MASGMAVSRWASQLEAKVMDVVTFSTHWPSIEVVNFDDTATIYYTVDGSIPALTGGGTSRSVAPGATDTVAVTPPITVRLISAGTPAYTVTGGEAAGGGGGGSGTSVPGASIVRAFPFAHNTPGILTGANIYTPTVGDLLLDAWVNVETAWNGTTPLCDIGMFPVLPDDRGAGFFNSSSDVIDLSVAASILDNENRGPLVGNGTISSPFSGLGGQALGQVPSNWLVPPTNSLSPTATSFLASPRASTFVAGTRCFPCRFTTTEPLKVVVSQNGTPGGADPGSTQGAATLYLVTCTPAT